MRLQLTMLLSICTFGARNRFVRDRVSNYDPQALEVSIKVCLLNSYS